MQYDSTQPSKERKKQLKIAIKELLYNKKKYILIELIIVLLMFMVLFLSGLVNGLGRAVTSGIELMDAKYFIVSESAEDIITVSNIDADVYDSIKNEIDVTTLDIQRMYIEKTASDEKINITYFAVEPGNVLDPAVYEGVNLGDSQLENAIVLDDDFKAEGIELGDIVLDSSTDMKFEVVGFAKDQMYGHTSVGFISTESYTALRTELNPNYSVSYHALTTNDDKVTSLDLDELVIDEKQTIIENIPSYSAEHITIIMVVWLLVVISSVIIGVFYYILTIQKEREFAVMKSIGVSMGQISGMIVSQVFIVAVFGAAIANILNFAMACSLPQTMPYYMRAYDACGVSLAFIAISILSSLLSVIRVSKVDPMTVIGGEQ